MVESNGSPYGVWDLYFSALCSWLLHPGYNREGTERPTIVDCADIADAMLEVRNARSK
jgi:hypothetical protein